MLYEILLTVNNHYSRSRFASAMVTLRCVYYDDMLISLSLSLSVKFRWPSLIFTFYYSYSHNCNVELPIIGTPNWYYITLISPYAGIYYWRSGDRTDEFSIKLEANDDETENSINVMGSEDEIERMYKALEWQEKGMIKVEPLFGGAE